MDVNGSYTFDAPREEVWQAVLDREVLAKSLPGIQDLESTGENEFRAKMKVRMGPVQGQFNGIVRLVDLNPPEGYHIHIDASGAQGFVKGEGDLKLIEQNGGTELQYTGEAQVGGRIASVGQRLMESSAQALIRQGLEAFDAQIQARMKGEEISEESLAADAPSEMEFALGVTQKMLEDLVPPERLGELIRIGFGVVAFLVVLRAVSEWWTNRLADRIAKLVDEKRL
jgi:carbon monoxide dehydrogenase subunit G